MSLINDIVNPKASQEDAEGFEGGIIDFDPTEDPTEKPEDKPEDNTEGEEAKKSEDKPTDEKTEKKETKDNVVEIDPTKDDTSGEAGSSGEKSTSSEVALQNFAKLLKEEGQLLSVSDEDLAKVKSTKDLSKLVQDEIKNKELADLNDRQKELLKGIREGIPTEYLLQSMNTEERLAQINDEALESNEDLQANLYMNDLMAKGFSREKAVSYVADMKKNDRLLDESKEALESIKIRHKESRQDAFKKADEEKQSYKKFIDKSEEILPGIKLSAKDRDDIYKSITTLEADENGQYIDAVIKERKKDPVKFVTKLHYFYKLGLFNDEPDLSALLKNTSKKAAEEFEASLRNDNNTHESLGSNINRDANFKPDDELLKALEDF